jgi:cardiolipin synthase
VDLAQALRGVLTRDVLVPVAMIVVLLYTIVSAVYIILENRSPQSTFAWLLLFLILPVVGLVIYRFTGQGWHAFSRENQLARQELGGELLRDMRPILTNERECAARIARERPASFREKLLRRSERSDNSILTGYNEVEILQDAAQKYPLLLADLRAARHHIHLNYYIWTEDSFTREVKEVLIERAHAGVKVRCLFDTSGGALSKGYLADLAAAGVAIHPYLDYRSFTKLHTVNYRSHRKLAIIDGTIGYVGGLNLDREQVKPAAFDTWRDTHLRIVGEAAQALQASFAISWFNTVGEEVTGAAYYPPVTIEQFLPMQITQGGPDSQWQAIRQLYFLMIVSAEKSIQLQSPFFIPDESIVEALRAAALAGVDVRLMFTPRGATYQIPYRAAHLFPGGRRGRGEDLPLPGWLFPPQNPQYRQRDHRRRHGEYGHPQLQPELRDDGRDLRRGEGAGVGGAIPGRHGKLRGVVAGRLPPIAARPAPARFVLPPRLPVAVTDAGWNPPRRCDGDPPLKRDGRRQPSRNGFPSPRMGGRPLGSGWRANASRGSGPQPRRPKPNNPHGKDHP